MISSAKKYLDPKLLIGFLNIAKVGDVFVLNTLVHGYYILNGRYRVDNLLDKVFITYLFSGILSFIVGLILNLFEYFDYVMLFNQGKSFLVFLLCLAYTGAYKVGGIARLHLNGIVIALIVGFAIVGFVMSGVELGMTLYETRGTEGESTVFWGWPQRWVVFPAIFFFYCLTFLLAGTRNRQNMWHIAFYTAGLVLFSSLLILSGTRSIMLGAVAGLVFMLIHQKRIPVLIGALGIVGLAYLLLQDADIRNVLADSFRIDAMLDFIEEGGNQEEGSLSNRFYNLWPGIISSLIPERILLGWGHLGPAYIPEGFFAGASIFGVGSAESQYMDVLARQGVVGLGAYLTLHVIGFLYSYRIYNTIEEGSNKTMWAASLYWQVAIFIHGMTVETTRFVFYGLFYFLFLGIVSLEYSRLFVPRTSGEIARRDLHVNCAQ